MSKPKFKIIKRAENPYDVLIESEVTVKNYKKQFTLSQVEENIKALNTKKTEIESLRALELAKIENIKINHPEIDLNTDEKVQIAFAVNQRAKNIVKSADEQLKIINDALKQETDDIKEVLKQTGLKLPE
jgi:hypothetical protein